MTWRAMTARPNHGALHDLPAAAAADAADPRAPSLLAPALTPAGR